MLNQARLKVLKVREDHVRNCLDEARKRLGEVTQNPERYREVLKLLIIQALYQVNQQSQTSIFDSRKFPFYLVYSRY